MKRLWRCSGPVVLSTPVLAVALFLLSEPVRVAVYEAPCHIGPASWRVWSVQKLGEQGPAALPPLLLALDDPDPEVREAARACADFRSHDPRLGVPIALLFWDGREPTPSHIAALFRGASGVRDALLDGAVSQNLGARRAALMFLWAVLSSKRGFERMEERDRRGSLSRWHRDLFEDSKDLRVLDIMGCYQIPRALEVYRRALADPDPEVAFYASLVQAQLDLDQAAPAGDLPVDVILDGLPEESPYCRSDRFRALRRVSEARLRTSVAAAPQRRGLQILKLLGVIDSLSITDEDHANAARLWSVLPPQIPELNRQLEAYLLAHFAENTRVGPPEITLVVALNRLHNGPGGEVAIAAQKLIGEIKEDFVQNDRWSEEAPLYLRAELRARAAPEILNFCAETKVVFEDGTELVRRQRELGGAKLEPALKRYAEAIAELDGGAVLRALGEKP